MILLYKSAAMDENLEDRAALLSRIELLEREKNELRNDIEQICMQNAGPSYAAVATRMHFQRTAGLEKEIDDLKKKLTSCLRENVNLQEELSQSYRIKNQLADLHASELTKSLEAEKQIKYFQGYVASAFSERDNAIMEAEIAKEKEELASQKLGIIQQKIEELSSVVFEEKKLSAILQTDLENKKKENEIFKQVITKFYDIRQQSLNEYNDVNWEDKCTTLLNDTEDMWTFTGHGETSSTKYITALEDEVEALRKSVINLRSKLQMGLEIEKHLKKVVRDLKNKKIFLEEKMKREISVLRGLYSQHRLDIMNLLEEECSQFKSVIDDIKEKMGQICIIEEVINLSPQKDITLQENQENDCRDVHISPDIGSDTITKENVYDSQKSSSSGTGNASEPLAQALQEKVAALLLLSQQEERYLLESNVKAALESKIEELQRNLIQVTNEKVVALMELAQLKQEHRLLQEKLNDDTMKGKLSINKEDKNMTQDKDGRLKSLLKKTYLSQWINPHQENTQISSSTMDFARMKVEYITLKESLQSMEQLTTSIRRLRLSLIKVTESVRGVDDSVLENVMTEAKLLKTALGSCVPVSWSAESDGDVEKVDGVSAAGIEMVELLILASQLLKNSMS
ncbi:hypothetical protein L2E82_36930 [Cichorium intybus]|uniref:Uncharacterized protein n=1 Tax=Cichorium intybus TaxID=13427 RepID=A0ACB9AE27_CICIN|nr:hypothetical protein L2E82_36930 [Cichorium intybus]